MGFVEIYDGLFYIILEILNCENTFQFREHSFFFNRLSEGPGQQLYIKESLLFSLHFYPNLVGIFFINM